MTNAFKKLLKKELGERKYYNYFAEYKRQDQLRKEKGEKIDSFAVYEDIYEWLKEKEGAALQQKHQQLGDTLQRVFRICNHYYFILITYLVSAFLIMFAGKVPTVNLYCILALSVAFLYKTYEFVVNKYSYLDAYIIIAYKAALEQLLSEKLEQ